MDMTGEGLRRLNAQRIKLGNCSRKWAATSPESKAAWRKICVQIIRRYRKQTKTWQVKGRRAFMSACLLGFIRKCPVPGVILPELPPETDIPEGEIINILPFHIRIRDVNNNPVKDAWLEIRSDKLGEVMYKEKSLASGYPPDFGMAYQFQPYDLAVWKIWEGIPRVVDVTGDMQVDLVIC